MSALGQLAAGLANELRNPLTSLKLLVQAAVEAGPEAGLRGRDLAVVADETARLERSLQSFLDFARPPRLEKRRDDVCQVLKQTLEMISARAVRQGVTIRSYFSAAAPGARGRPRTTPPGVSQPDAQFPRRPAPGRRHSGDRPSSGNSGAQRFRLSKQPERAYHKQPERWHHETAAMG